MIYCRLEMFHITFTDCLEKNGGKIMHYAIILVSSKTGFLIQGLYG